MNITSNVARGGSHVKNPGWPGRPGHMSKTRAGRVTCQKPGLAGSHVKRHSHTQPRAILRVPRDLIAET